MPKLIILYGQPDDPAAFEEYYASRHLPYASEHMPGVTGAENLRIVGTPDGGTPVYYRLSQLTYNSMDDLRSGIASEKGQSVLADLANFATGGATVLLADD
ncbi:MAG: EthD family reductase [Nocardioidaceae bacterium]